MFGKIVMCLATVVFFAILCSGCTSDKGLNTLNPPKSSYYCVHGHVYSHIYSYATVPIYNDEDKPMKCEEWNNRYE